MCAIENFLEKFSWWWVTKSFWPNSLLKSERVVWVIMNTDRLWPWRWGLQRAPPTVKTQSTTILWECSLLILILRHWSTDPSSGLLTCNCLHTCCILRLWLGQKKASGSQPLRMTMRPAWGQYDIRSKVKANLGLFYVAVSLQMHHPHTHTHTDVLLFSALLSCCYSAAL